MLIGLLDRLVPERRHLAILVGVLSLMFVLTAVLAVNAQRSDTARRQQATAALEDLVASAAVDWGTYLQQFVGGSLVYSYRVGLRDLRRDPHAPLAELAAHAEPALFCPACAPRQATPSHFAIDLVTGATEQLGAAALSQAQLAAIAARAAAGDHALMHDSVGAALYVLHGGTGAGATYATNAADAADAADARDAADAVAVAAYIRLGPGGRGVRVTGYTLEPYLLGAGFAAVLDSMRLLPPATRAPLHNSDVFAARITAGSTVLLDGAADATDIRGRHALQGAPVAGLLLEVALRPGAADAVLLGGHSSSGFPFLAGIMLTITVLLAMALLLVRREAELVRLRADFVSSVSHELRTPLAQIRMFTETLLLGRVRSDVERRRSLEIIDQEARRLTRLVENVLLFSKSQGGRVTPLAPEPTRVAEEIRGAAESFVPLCRSRSVELRLELQEDITAPVDRGALRQILLNLIENALKYGPTGQRITVGAALFDDTARIWVDDEGPGIPLAERERVFDSFYRIPNADGARQSGSGIGLAVVRELARLHGGTARAQAAPGGGARLLLELPGAHAAAAAADPDLAAAS